MSGSEIPEFSFIMRTLRKPLLLVFTHALSRLYLKYKYEWAENMTTYDTYYDEER